MESKQRKVIDGAPIDVVDVSKNRIKVLFAISGNLDRVGDILSETALAKAKAPYPLMWRHFPELAPLGEVVKIERRERAALPAEVLRADPDVTGGWVAHARVFQSDRGRELLDILKDGFVGGASFGYRVNRAKAGKTRSGKPGRMLEDVSLYEVSVLELGGQANQAAMTIKSWQQQQREMKELLDWYKRDIEGPERREELRRKQTDWELQQEIEAILAW